MGIEDGNTPIAFNTVATLWLQKNSAFVSEFATRLLRSVWRSDSREAHSSSMELLAVFTKELITGSSVTDCSIS